MFFFYEKKLCINIESGAYLKGLTFRKGPAATWDSRRSIKEEGGVLILKNGLGYTLGDFFTNSSGHPGPEVGQPRIFFRVSMSNRCQGDCDLCAIYLRCSAYRVGFYESKLQA
jgi:hypothetical protein